MGKNCRFLLNFIISLLVLCALQLFLLQAFQTQLHFNEFSTHGDGGLESSPTNCVAIVGATSWLGFWLSLTMAYHNLGCVIGVDDLTPNDSSSSDILYKRADVLENHGVHFIRHKICNDGFVDNIDRFGNLTHIIYLPDIVDTTPNENNLCLMTNIFEHVLRRPTHRPYILYPFSSSPSRNPVGATGGLYSTAQIYYTLNKISSVGLQVPGFIWGSELENSSSHESEDFINEMVIQIIDILVQPKTAGASIVYMGEPCTTCPTTMTISRTGFPTLSPSKRLTPFTGNYHGRTLLEADFQKSRKYITDINNRYPLSTNKSHLCASECFPKSVNACQASAFDEAASMATKLTDGCDIVVYTVVYKTNMGTGERARLYEPEQRLSGPGNMSIFPNACYVAFAHPVPLLHEHSTRWQVIPLNKVDIWGDDRRTGKFVKFSPSTFFAATVRYAIYVDAKLRLLMDPRDIVLQFMRSPPSTGGGRTVLAAVRHPSNRNPFEEAIAINHFKASWRKNISFTLWTMEHQLRTYRTIQNTHNLSLNNMIDSAILVHDLKSKEGIDFRCAWSLEYYQNADRDQISFPYVLARRAQAVGRYLERKEEWCKIDTDITTNISSYVRILPDEAFHWWKTQTVAIDLGLRIEETKK